MIEEKDIQWGFWQQCLTVVKTLYAMEFKDRISDDFGAYMVTVRVYANNNGKKGKLLNEHTYQAGVKYLTENGYNKKKYFAELANKCIPE